MGNFGHSVVDQMGSVRPNLSLKGDSLFWELN